MRLGPILRYELVRTARRPAHYLMRAALGLSLLYVSWALYDSIGHSRATVGGGARSESVDARDVRWLADRIFLELAWTQGLLLLLFVPGLVAGSIAEEDRRGTMIELLASPLSSGAIALGKLAGRLVPIGVAFAVGLPLVAPLALLGALDPAIVAQAYAMLIALTLFVASLSLLVSALIVRPRAAILAAYLLVWGWLLLPIWLAPIVQGLPGPLGGLRTLNGWILLSHPLEAATHLLHISGAKLSRYSPALRWAQAGLSRTFPWVIGSQAAASAFFLLLAVPCLRPRRLGLRRWARAFGSSRTASASARPTMGDDPMLWKERYAPGGSRPTLAWLVIVLLSVLVLGPLVGPAVDAFREWQESRWGEFLGVSIQYRSGLNDSLRKLNTGLYMLGLVAVAATAATSVTRERERGSWTGLATTLLTGREVTRAKISGSLRGVRGLAIPALALWGMGLANGSVHPVGVLAAAAGLVVFARYAAALGVLCSMLSPTSDRALVTTFLALLASNAWALLFVPLDLIGPLAGSRSGVYLAGVSPLMEWVSLVSPFDVRAALDGRDWETRINLPFTYRWIRVRLDLGLIRTFSVSLALHAVATIVASRAAAWAFDARRGRQS